MQMDGGAVFSEADRSVGFNRHCEPQLFEFRVALQQGKDELAPKGFAYFRQWSEPRKETNLFGSAKSRCSGLCNGFSNLGGMKFYVG